MKNIGIGAIFLASLITPFMATGYRSGNNLGDESSMALPVPRPVLAPEMPLITGRRTLVYDGRPHGGGRRRMLFDLDCLSDHSHLQKLTLRNLDLSELGSLPSTFRNSVSILHLDNVILPNDPILKAQFLGALSGLETLKVSHMSARFLLEASMPTLRTFVAGPRSFDGVKQEDLRSLFTRMPNVEEVHLRHGDVGNFAGIIQNHPEITQNWEKLSVFVPPRSLKRRKSADSDTTSRKVKKRKAPAPNPTPRKVKKRKAPAPNPTPRKVKKRKAPAPNPAPRKEEEKARPLSPTPQVRRFLDSVLNRFQGRDPLFTLELNRGAFSKGDDQVSFATQCQEKNIRLIWLPERG